jgi:hypothetical protein
MSTVHGVLHGHEQLAVLELACRQARRHAQRVGADDGEVHVDVGPGAEQERDLSRRQRRELHEMKGKDRLQEKLVALHVSQLGDVGLHAEHERSVEVRFVLDLHLSDARPRQGRGEHARLDECVELAVAHLVEDAAHPNAELAEEALLELDGGRPILFHVGAAEDRDAVATAVLRDGDLAHARLEQEPGLAAVLDRNVAERGEAVVDGEEDVGADPHDDPGVVVDLAERTDGWRSEAVLHEHEADRDADRAKRVTIGRVA